MITCIETLVTLERHTVERYLDFTGVGMSGCQQWVQCTVYLSNALVSLSLLTSRRASARTTTVALQNRDQI